MEKECPHCHETIIYEKPQQIGGHMTNCKSNPKLLQYKENIKIGREKWKEEKCPNIKRNMKCLYCESEYTIECTDKEFNRGEYKKCCSEKCARKYSSSFVDRTGIKKSICKECGDEIDVYKTTGNNVLCEDCRKDFYKIRKYKGNGKFIFTKDSRCVCKFCGQEKCDKPELCRKYQMVEKSLVKFGYDLSVYGSSDYYIEFDRIKHLLTYEYESGMSLVEISEKYKMNYQSIYMIFKSLNIDRRNISDSVRNAIKRGRWSLPNENLYPYKSGYHTTWEGKEIFFRSSYEEEYCRSLDEKKIRYDVEKIRIQYFDTQKNFERTAIPDFYLIDTNEIVEIKSDWTYDEQNMVDKFKAYKELGYNVKLILEKEEKIL